MQQNTTPEEQRRNSAAAALATLIIGPPLGFLALFLSYLIDSTVATIESATLPDIIGQNSISDHMGVVLFLLFCSYLFGGIPALIASAYVYFRLRWRRRVSYAETIALALLLGLAFSSLPMGESRPDTLFFTLPAVASAITLRTIASLRGWIMR